MSESPRGVANRQAAAPLVGAGGAAGTSLPNLKWMPIMYLLAERGGRTASAF
jgi:hypothetical protein